MKQAKAAVEAAKLATVRAELELEAANKERDGAAAELATEESSAAAQARHHSAEADATAAADAVARASRAVDKATHEYDAELLKVRSAALRDLCEHDAVPATAPLVAAAQAPPPPSDVSITLPADVLELLMQMRLRAEHFVVTPNYLGGARVCAEWRSAIRRVSAAWRLMRCVQTIGPAPTDGRHGGPFDGPRAVAPLAGGGVLVADTRNSRIRRVSGGAPGETSLLATDETSLLGSGERHSLGGSYVWTQGAQPGAPCRSRRFVPAPHSSALEESGARILDEGSEMLVVLPDCVSVAPTVATPAGDRLADHVATPYVWATNRGSNPIALQYGPLAKRGHLRLGISLPRTSGKPRHVVGLHFSAVLSARLLLFRSSLEVSRINEIGDEANEEGAAGTAVVGTEADAADDDDGGRHALALRADRRSRCEYLSDNALCVTSHGSQIYIGDGSSHAVLVYDCTREGRPRVSYVRQIGNKDRMFPVLPKQQGPVYFREPISVAVGRSGSGRRRSHATVSSAPLLHVADYDRVHILTLEGTPLQALPMSGFSTRRVNGICIDDDDVTLWLVSAEHHSLYRYCAIEVPPIDGATMVAPASAAAGRASSEQRQQEDDEDEATPGEVVVVDLGDELSSRLMLS